MTSSHPRGPCHPGQAKAQLYRLLETLAGVMMLRGPPAYVRSITGRSSSLWPCVNGSPHSNSQPAPSSTAAPGQTAILLHRDGLPPPISCQSPGAPVHPLIPDDAMSVSNQPCVDGPQFARVLNGSATLVGPAMCRNCCAALRAAGYQGRPTRGQPPYY